MRRVILVLVVATLLVGPADGPGRAGDAVKGWAYEELTEKASLVVLVSLDKSAPGDQTLIDKKDRDKLTVMRSTFQVEHVIKGEKPAGKSLTLVHTKWRVPKDDLRRIGHFPVTFAKTRSWEADGGWNEVALQYLLFVRYDKKLEAFVPVSGLTQSGQAVRTTHYPLPDE
jgi:hypothetical protein